MFYIFWKYELEEGRIAEFESVYGPTGAWASFFSMATGYLGSQLFRSKEEKTGYLLIDTWNSQEDYGNFLKINSAEYDRLSAKFNSLYLTEQLLGMYFKLT